MIEIGGTSYTVLLLGLVKIGVLGSSVSRVCFINPCILFVPLPNPSHVPLSDLIWKVKIPFRIRALPPFWSFILDRRRKGLSRPLARHCLWRANPINICFSIIAMAWQLRLFFSPVGIRWCAFQRYGGVPEGSEVTWTIIVLCWGCSLFTFVFLLGC